MGRLWLDSRWDILYTVVMTLTGLPSEMAQWPSSLKVFTNNLRLSSGIVSPDRIMEIAVSPAQPALVELPSVAVSMDSQVALEAPIASS
jgi:hypothetical protein